MLSDITSVLRGLFSSQPKPAGTTMGSPDASVFARLLSGSPGGNKQARQFPVDKESTTPEEVFKGDVPLESSGDDQSKSSSTNSQGANPLSLEEEIIEDVSTIVQGPFPWGSVTDNSVILTAPAIPKGENDTSRARAHGISDMQLESEDVGNEPDSTASTTTRISGRATSSQTRDQSIPRGPEANRVPTAANEPNILHTSPETATSSATRDVLSLTHEPGDVLGHSPTTELDPPRNQPNRETEDVAQRLTATNSKPDGTPATKPLRNGVGQPSSSSHDQNILDARLDADARSVAQRYTIAGSVSEEGLDIPKQLEGTPSTHASGVRPERIDKEAPAPRSILSQIADRRAANAPRSEAVDTHRVADRAEPTQTGLKTDSRDGQSRWIEPQTAQSETATKSAFVEKVESTGSSNVDRRHVGPASGDVQKASVVTKHSSDLDRRPVSNTMVTNPGTDGSGEISTASHMSPLRNAVETRGSTVSTTALSDFTNGAVADSTTATVRVLNISAQSVTDPQATVQKRSPESSNTRMHTTTDYLRSRETSTASPSGQHVGTAIRRDQAGSTTSQPAADTRIGEPRSTVVSNPDNIDADARIRSTPTTIDGRKSNDIDENRNSERALRLESQLDSETLGGDLRQSKSSDESTRGRTTSGNEARLAENSVKDVDHVVAQSGRDTTTEVNDRARRQVDVKVDNNADTKAGDKADVKADNKADVKADATSSGESDSNVPGTTKQVESASPTKQDSSAPMEGDETIVADRSAADVERATDPHRTSASINLTNRNSAATGLDDNLPQTSNPTAVQSEPVDNELEATQSGADVDEPAFDSDVNEFRPAKPVNGDQPVAVSKSANAADGDTLGQQTENRQTQEQLSTIKKNEQSAKGPATGANSHAGNSVSDAFSVAQQLAAINAKAIHGEERATPIRNKRRDKLAQKETSETLSNMAGAAKTEQRHSGDILIATKPQPESLPFPGNLSENAVQELSQLLDDSFAQIESSGENGRSEKAGPTSLTSANQKGGSWSTTSSFLLRTRSVFAPTSVTQSQDATWKSVQMKLDDGDGFVTIRTRKEDGTTKLTLEFSDSNIRAAVESQADRLRESLELRYETSVDLSFGAEQHGAGDFQRETTETSASSAVGVSDRESSGEAEDEVQEPRIIEGSTASWIG